MKGRIDFLGCPGVGKSTLLKSLLKQRSKKNDRWLTITEFKSNLAYEVNLNHARDSKSIASRVKYFLLSVSRRIEKIHPYLVNDSQSVANLNHIIWNQRELYEDFIEIALKGSEIRQVNPVRRMIGLGWFLEVLKDTVLVNQFNSDHLVLFDESLSLKIYGITHSEPDNWEKISNEYFKYIPRPEILVLCTLAPKEILERVRVRELENKTINQVHEGLNNEELLAKLKIQQDISTLGAKILADRGTQVIELDMSTDLKTNTSKLTRFLRDKVYITS